MEVRREVLLAEGLPCTQVERCRKHSPVEAQEYRQVAEAREETNDEAQVVSSQRALNAIPRRLNCMQEAVENL